MDNKIKMLRNGNMPKNEWRNLLCNVLEELAKVPVQEAGSLSFAQAIDKVLGKGVSIRHTAWAKGLKIVPYDIDKGYAFWDGTSHTPDVPMNAGMLYSGWEVISRFNLTLQEALQAVKEGRKVQHETWDGDVYLSLHKKGLVTSRTGIFTPKCFEIELKHLDGWRVLDK